MKKIAIFCIITTPIFLQAQIGYLGNRFSSEFSNDIGIRGEIYSSLKASYIINKKIEAFVQVGSALGSELLTEINYDVLPDQNQNYYTDYINKNFGIKKPMGYTSPKKYRTDIKINNTYFGGGIRFYRKTKLAPVGQYIEIGYLRIGGSVKQRLTFEELQHQGENVMVTDSITNSSSYEFVPEVNETSYDEDITINTIHQLHFGLHRKRVFKEGWFLSTGMNIFVQLKNPSDKFLDLSKENLYDPNSLKFNRVSLNISLGKVIF